MSRLTMVLFTFWVCLVALQGCIIHDPGYYPAYRGSYSGPYYPYYYGPYLYAPFWVGGYYFFDDFDRRGNFHHPRGFDHHRGGRGRR